VTKRRTVAYLRYEHGASGELVDDGLHQVAAVCIRR
jgi:hypothetical protein